MKKGNTKFSQKRVRKAKYPVIEEQLMGWIEYLRVWGCPVTSPLIKSFAIELAKKMENLILMQVMVGLKDFNHVSVSDQLNLLGKVHHHKQLNMKKDYSK